MEKSKILDVVRHFHLVNLSKLRYTLWEVRHRSGERFNDAIRQTESKMYAELDHMDRICLALINFYQLNGSLEDGDLVDPFDDQVDRMRATFDRFQEQLEAEGLQVYDTEVLRYGSSTAPRVGRTRKEMEEQKPE